MNNSRVLGKDEDGARFRITRLRRTGGPNVIAVTDSPSEAIDRVFAENYRTVAVDRRGYIYADNYKETL